MGGSIAELEGSLGIYDNLLREGWTRWTDGVTASAPSIPCSVRFDSVRGRFLVATRCIEEGEVVLRCPSFERAPLGNHKKRVCAHCFTSSRRRLETKCEGCNQLWYCDEVCRAKHRSSGLHSDLECRVLSGSGSAKFNGDMESLIRILARILLRRRGTALPRERAGSPGITGFGTLLTCRATPLTSFPSP